MIKCTDFELKRKRKGKGTYFLLAEVMIYQMNQSIPIQSFEIKNNKLKPKNLKSSFFEGERMRERKKTPQITTPNYN